MSSDASAAVRQMKVSCHNCMQKLDVTSFPAFSRFPCPVCGTELIVPARFDTYLLEERGGSGGMATVYRALDPALDREVAIKVLKPEFSDKRERVELFLHEARAAATINHFAVVPIYTCGVYQDQAYIVMQYMDGGSLEQQLNQACGKLPVLDVAVWIRDIAEGLENAKEHGIIHHDVKPGNILLDGDGKAKIGDFGIAQIIHSGKSDSEEETIQDIAKTWLSPHYVSPEKVRTGKEGSEGDIYSLGATFYHLLTGIPPFCHENVEELLRKRLSEQPLPPHYHRPEIGSGLSQLIMAMMSRSPSDRPTYGTIVAALNGFIRKKSGSAETPLPAETIRPEVSSVRPEEEIPESDARPGRRRSVFLAVCFLPLFVLLAAGGYGLFHIWRQDIADFSSEAPGDAEAAVRVNDLDPNPEITLVLASGDLASALVFADATASDPSVSPKKRITALFQYACALYLAADRDPRAAIRRRLTELESSSAAGNEEGPAALLPGIRLLAGMDPGAAEDPPETAGAELLAARCFLSAGTQSSSASEIRLLSRKIDSLEKSLDALPPGSWLAAAWKNHVPAWRQTVLRRNGKKDEVEPLFARLIVKPAKWAGPSAFSPRTLPDKFNDLFVSGPADDKGKPDPQTPELSAASLKSAAEKYRKYGRPVPEAPALISGRGIRPYLKRLPEKLRSYEERRLRVMCSLPAYITAAAVGSTYQADEFTLTDHTVLGAGVALFNEQYLVYRIRREGGRFEDRRLDWDRIPAREMLTILLYYMTYRENAVLSAGDPAGGDEAVERLADAFLRYAVFAQWYGYCDEAAKAAGKARALLPGPRIEKTIEHLLLR